MNIRRFKIAFEAKTIYLIILFLFIGFNQSMFAAHIVGGDASYRCLGIDTNRNEINLELTFTLYRDQFSGGAAFDDPARFGVYRFEIDSWKFVEMVENIPVRDVSSIPFEDNPCVEIPSNVGVEKGVYTFDIDLDIINSSYKIVYQRCCRNNSINNLINPGDTGAALEIDIRPEAQMVCNNSATFNNFPPIFICNGYDINFDHSATDAEGDSLVYSFCAPLSAGGTDGSGGPGSGDADACTGVTPLPEDCPPPFAKVDFLAPFTAFNPMGGNPIISIDSETGLISGEPTLNGQYVVGICVEEYRDGQLLSTLRRDFQFNVVTCNPLVFAEIASDRIDTIGFMNGEALISHFVQSCGPTTVDLENSSYQQSNIISYEWQFFNIASDTVFRFSRDVTVDFPGVGDYQGLMIVNKGLECADTALVNVGIFPSMEADFEVVMDTCGVVPVQFNDLSSTNSIAITDWDWNFNNEGTSTVKNPSFQFLDAGDKGVSLIATDDNGCSDQAEATVRYYPVPPILLVEPSRFIGCEPGEVTFTNLSSTITPEYDILWNFGDGSQSDEFSPTHNFESAGTYSVDVSVVSPLGCIAERSFPNWISIKESPKADFSFTPEEFDEINNKVDFTNLSVGASSYQWDIGGDFVTTLQNPSYMFQDTGIYEAKLIALHPNGCPDTIIKLLDVKPLTGYFMPNAFTPNGDGNNDIFIGKGAKSLINFSLSVWNRWGEKVFETENPENGWNGKKDNTGLASPQGVYIYNLSYESARGEKFMDRNHVTLVR